MSLAVFDIGGTTVKHGVWMNQRISQVSAFQTPETFEELLEKMKQTINAYNKPFEGIAISAPGAVDQEQRKILGISAVDYIHQRPIFDELEKYFALPVSIENDANCAGVAEVELGVGKDAQNIAFVVLGTGVGGALFIRRELYKGSHLFGGEVGLLKSQHIQTFSQNGTLVKAANFYSDQTNTKIEGKELYELNQNGDSLAAELLNDMYQTMASNLYNIQVMLDPELIVLGGGISKRPELAEELSKRLLEQLEAEGVGEIMPTIKCCKFHNDANLIGAALNFQKRT
ncbi:ROK family protein [Candidatus Enterococcus murrayae]|uniref:ROK family protein n=1 Tax=Candidatus Enterococcus murrayae TaxID=2815321 RepID=A0ABS3HKS0_9ENTE|nr:ROK family protein [Enterococcus sp. MJM16]MBO0453908.1 ROK family protein [Enterococcus sp. MJM16]